MSEVKVVVDLIGYIDNDLYEVKVVVDLVKIEV